MKTTIINLPQELLLTKEGFEEYAKRLREETAKEHGMTLEEWDQAIRDRLVVNPIANQTTGSGYDI